MVDDFERAARRGKYEQAATAQGADEAWVHQLEHRHADRAAERPAALEILERYFMDRDPGSLREALQGWSQNSGYGAFGGVNGQMFLNQLVNMSGDADELAGVLTDTLAVPTGADEAARKIQRLSGYAEAIKKGAAPAPRRAMFFLSFLWSLQDHEDWPCAWNSAERTLERLGWLEPFTSLEARYLEFRNVVLDLPGSPEDVEGVLYWLDHHPFVGLAPSLVDRCARTGDGDDWRPANARAILGELRLLGEALQDQVANALGRSVKVDLPGVFWKQDRVREDGWVRWGLAGEPKGAALRAWVTFDGTYLGLHPGWYRDGWYEEAREAIEPLAPAEFGFHAVRIGDQRVEPTAGAKDHGEFLLARFFPGAGALDRATFKDDVVRAATDLQPSLDRLMSLLGKTPGDHGRPEHDPLRPLVDEFVSERPYPTDKDAAHQADRRDMAELLAKDAIMVIDLPDLRKIYNGSRYASPGPQSVLNVSMRDASPVELEDYLQRIQYLLWGDDPDEHRIDRVLDIADRGIKGLGESVIMKLLAIVHPDRYLPIYPYVGEYGKLKALQVLGLTPPPSDLSRGAKQTLANDQIRGRLDAFFPNDPWAQAQFVYWLPARPSVEDGGDDVDPLDELADELLVERTFLDDIVGLLAAKGQVIFFGPPGTGKTFVARKLAAVLASDANRWQVVQFHPSTSYEDFFEGYRPEGIDGSLSYRLTPGPLALMAAKAEASPGVQHVMVIDEINRANLPKVFGELLYLLEYRDDEVRTLYRADDAFSLPSNLVFIGTMNTADRSIALVDAALRRRFAFVPFFPNSGAVLGLLGRWLEAHGEPAWIADVVDMVNAELIDELGGPDLQLGPSYFMRKGLSEDALRRIWEYSIFPLIQDQLFGEPARIAAYEFDAVMKRFNKEAGVASSAELDAVGAIESE